MLECTLNALCNFNPRQEPACYSRNLGVGFLPKWATMGDEHKFTLQETDLGTDSDSDPIPVFGSKIEIWIWLREVWKLLHSAM